MWYVKWQTETEGEVNEKIDPQWAIAREKLNLESKRPSIPPVMLKRVKMHCEESATLLGLMELEAEDQSGDSLVYLSKSELSELRQLADSAEQAEQAQATG